MQVSATVSRVVKVCSYSVNTKARAFGRKIEQAETTPRFKMWRPALKAFKNLSQWVISHTNNINPALGSARMTHPVDTVLSGDPIRFPAKLKKEMIQGLHDPSRGQSFREDNISKTFESDVFRQDVRLHVQSRDGEPKKVFDSMEFSKRMEGQCDHDEKLEQAKDTLSAFAGRKPELVKTLSALANQSSQFDPLWALTRLTNEQMGEQGQIVYGGNDFASYDITRKPDGNYVVEQNCGIQTLLYQSHAEDTLPVPLKGAAAHIRVKYLISPEGKVLRAEPDIHMKWPGFGPALAAGRASMRTAQTV
ncbi:hypothetical protein ACWJJH_12885 [Endozoicomonadaceae bacterium StTr2]